MYLNDRTTVNGGNSVQEICLVLFTSRHPPGATMASRVSVSWIVGVQAEVRTLRLPDTKTGCCWHKHDKRGLISLWLYKEHNNLRDWKKCIYSTYSPLSSTHLWLRCSNFFNPSKKNYFGCAANMKIENRKSQRLISPPPQVFFCKFHL
jgi:hypothetical protein